MSTVDPQSLYMIMVLPSLFGLTLLGEGINKVIHEEWSGIVSVIFGFILVVGVIMVYIFFSSYFVTHRGV